MTVSPKIRQSVIFDVTAGGLKSRRQSLRKFGPEIAVIMTINPQHRYPCRSSELRRCFDQIVGGAIVVGFAVEVAAAPSRKTYNGTHSWWILAGKRDRTPAATGLTDDNDLIPLDEWLNRHVFDHPCVNRGNRQSCISKVGVRTIADT